ncbi:WD40/YVTN/BNR-like repeat-containing protein [Candidatus Uabimicrobium sp. HlEnr_7]|uniref:WD40/YVTN/BNR-like repeat-containing protein n=1 Tax=Candidatus Uabimicrobium helgolandensis TaxID=3095367 RepID=UPI003557271E
MKRTILFVNICLFLTTIAFAQNRWIPIFGYENMEIRSIAMNKDGKFIAVTEKGILCDGIFTELMYDSYEVVIDNKECIFARTKYGVFRSEDNGAQWTLSISSQQVPMPAQIEKCFTIDSENKIFFYSYYLYESIDQGKTWNQVNIAPVRRMAIDPNTKTILTTYWNTWFKSVNGAKSWKEIESPGTAQEIDITANGNIVFTPNTFYENALHLSSDKGNTWVTRNKGLPKSPTGQLPKVNVMITHKNDVFLGTDYSGVYQLENGSESWKYLNRGLAATKINCLLHYKGHLYAGTDRGIWELKMSDQ